MSEEMKKDAPFEERRGKNFLDKLNHSGVGAVLFEEKAEELVEENLSEIVAKCKESKEKNRPLLIAFDSVDNDGNLSVYTEDGVELTLTGEDFKVVAPYYKKANKSKFINVPIFVKVKDIDEANKKISLVGASRDSKELSEDSKQILRIRIRRELNRCLENGETPRVWGRVTSVNEGIAKVLLFDEQVAAEIEVSHWRKGYTRFFKTVCRKDSIYEFDVIGHRTVKKERTETPDKRVQKYDIFALSRENIEPNPFDLVIERGLKENDIISVKCIEIPDPTFADKNYFWGSCARFPGVDIAVRIVKNSKNLQYKEGFSYNCKIRELNPEAGNIYASAFEYTKETKEAVIKFL